MRTLCKSIMFAAAFAASGPILTLPLHADAPSPARVQATFEVRFLENMIDHHAMGVAMAELCAGRTVHTELLELCHSIAEVQAAEIETMQGWLSDWYGIDYEPEMKRGAEKSMERMAALEGVEFEEAFLEMMIRHHAGAVREARRCERRAYHEELIALCESIEVSQIEEIEQMEAWLAEWY
jgi:uncharacterized protein (DUF305 family)